MVTAAKHQYIGWRGEGNHDLYWHSSVNCYIIVRVNLAVSESWRFFFLLVIPWKAKSSKLQNYVMAKCRNWSNFENNAAPASGWSKKVNYYFLLSAILFSAGFQPQENRKWLLLRHSECQQAFEFHCIPLLPRIQLSCWPHQLLHRGSKKTSSTILPFSQVLPSSVMYSLITGSCKCPCYFQGQLLLYSAISESCMFHK